MHYAHRRDLDEYSQIVKLISILLIITITKIYQIAGTTLIANITIRQKHEMCVDIKFVQLPIGRKLY